MTYLNNELVDVVGFARILDVSRSTLYSLLKRDKDNERNGIEDPNLDPPKLPERRRIGRLKKWLRSDIEAYLNRLPKA